jgi:quinohemoprotein ethanol dehydrogenase
MRPRSSVSRANLKDIVFNGPFRDKGMPDFTSKLTNDDGTRIVAFIQGTADAIRPQPMTSDAAPK